MKSHTFSTTLVSLLATVANSTAGDHEAAHRSSPPAAAFTALAPLPAPTTPYRFGSSGGRRWRSTRTSSRSRPAISGRHLPEAGFNSRRIHFVGGAAAAGSGLEMTRAAASGLAGGLSWRRRQQQRRRWGQGGGRQQGRGWFAQSAAAAQPSPSSSSFGWPEGGGQWAEEEDRCIRRLDTAIRRIFYDYYSCTDVRETKKSLGVFLKEASAALEQELGRSSSTSTGIGSLSSPSSPSPLSSSPSSSSPAARIASRLKARLLESSERLNYHLDGDQPMTLYRFWIRGRPIDVYERDLFHCPRWIELIAETKRQMDVPPVVVERPLGTVCYPSGDMFEGQVDSLVRIAKAGTTPPASAAFPRRDTKAVFDAEMSSYDTATAAATAAAAATGSESGGGWAVAGGVQTVSGLVALTIDCLEDGMSDEATILQRHVNSPDFGHPLLRLASPSDSDPDHPHMPDDPEMNPALLRADEELTDDDLALGERGAKELMHDRRRAQLDVYLICAAYRQYLPPPPPPPLTPAATDASQSRGSWQLDEADARRLDEMIARVVSP
ncbi:unnamed protein product [Pylaiella littoralis]